MAIRWSTHGLNQYGYQLTTLMVNDSNHEGFPVGVMFSSSVDTATFIVFFNENKKTSATG